MGEVQANSVGRWPSSVISVVEMTPSSDSIDALGALQKDLSLSQLTDPKAVLVRAGTRVILLSIAVHSSRSQGSLNGYTRQSDHRRD